VKNIAKNTLCKLYTSVKRYIREFSTVTIHKNINNFRVDQLPIVEFRITSSSTCERILTQGTDLSNIQLARHISHSSSRTNLRQEDNKLIAASSLSALRIDWTSFGQDKIEALQELRSSQPFYNSSTKLLAWTTLVSYLKLMSEREGMWLRYVTNSPWLLLAVRKQRLLIIEKELCKVF
jgi:hypothetical protein